jgi:peptide/nickel transport system substrate-binding protein
VPLGNQGTSTIRVESGPSGIAIGATGVWVTNSLDGTLSRIDPDNDVATTMTVGDGPTGVTVGTDNVWVADHFGDAVARVATATSAVASPIEMGASPVAMTLADGDLWIAASAPPSAHRGGTLRVAFNELPASIDPAFAYNFVPDWQIITLTDDGLVGFDRVGGPQGAALVPDLATSLPVPTDGGRTYTFQIRRGIDYSTGASVQPQDFRRGIERTLLIHKRGNPVAYYTGIVGAATCKSIASCDLTRGIVTSDTARTITFNLRAPDPDFLYKLGLPFAYPVPAGTEMTRASTTPLPGTGPYVISAYHPKRDPAIELTRNPHFMEWSGAAQPGGYPDQIDISTGMSPTIEESLVKQGRLDVMAGDFLPANLLSQLDTSFPGQLRDYALQTSSGFELNLRTYPFNKFSVRRAVNLAVNRARWVSLFGGPQLGQVTCQILPPDFPGYQRYCRYTRHPNAAGTWSAPDLPKALQLVKASGTLKARVTVWTSARVEPAAHYFVSVLRHLHYRATLHVVQSSNRYFRQLGRKRIAIKVQAAFNGWLPDYPSPSNLLDLMFACHSDVVDANILGFCDPQVQTELKRALAVQASQPAAAGKDWGRVDRSVVDTAAWVALPTQKDDFFVSRRTGNVQDSPQWGMLLSQLWVQ